jgi:hypothetical protein
VPCAELACGPRKTDVLRKSRVAFQSNAASFAYVHSSSPPGVSRVSFSSSDVDAEPVRSSGRAVTAACSVAPGVRRIR